MADKNLSELEKEFCNLEEEISELRKEIEDKEYEKECILKKIAKIKSTYTTIDNFPYEFKKIKMYVPEKYRMCNYGDQKTNGYKLKYDIYKFDISDRPDEYYPYSFEIVCKDDSGKKTYIVESGNP